MIKFALVVPRQGFIDNAASLFEEHNRLEPDFNGEPYQLEEVVVTNKNVSTVQLDADIIITRGLYAEILSSIKQKLPVVEIPLRSLDLIRSLVTDPSITPDSVVGVIGSQNMITGLKELSGLLDIPIKTYILGPNDDRYMLVSHAIRDGCNVISGSLQAQEYARALNVGTLPIRTSRESFWGSITAAKRAAQISRTEQEKTSRMEAILDFSREGILFVDYRKRITTINDAAVKILGPGAQAIIGKRIEETTLPLEFKRILVGMEDLKNELVPLRSMMLNMSKVAINLRNHIAGSVITFQDVTSLQELESKVRSKIYDMGHVARANFSDIIGDAPTTRMAIEKAQKYARTSSPILLIGESGTGKELFAQSIHNSSGRAQGPFVAVNCAAIPESLLESEFFGYTDGAFTGAQKGGRPGFFELAHGGTIFLDEVGEIAPAVQAKLLRAVQEKVVMRVGGGRAIPVDVRVISATNKDLYALTKQGKFREDLYYRLNVLRVNIPSLAQRQEDILPLIRHYFSRSFPQIRLEEEAALALRNSNWTGNIRHLFNMCERIGVVFEAGVVTREDVTAMLDEEMGGAPDGAPPAAPPPAQRGELGPEQILTALEHNAYHRGDAASELGISRSTLWRKMREFSL